MKITKKILWIFFLAVSWLQAQQTTEKDHRLDWFKDAKLGVFIHWGYYGVNGITESWSLYHKRISHEDYLKQGEQFTAENYNPDAWLDVFRVLEQNM